MTYDSENIFAKIMRGEIPCKKVYEDEFSFAFHDINPAAPVHVLVLPKGEYISFDDFSANASAEFMKGFFSSVRKVVEMLDLADGYRLITNHKHGAGQSVFHFHIHILGGKKLDRLLP